MTELSPAAQAVLEVYRQPYIYRNLYAAAALRVLADQVVPPSIEEEFFDRNPSLTLQKAVEIRSKILAIAAELEPQ